MFLVLESVLLLLPPHEMIELRDCLACIPFPGLSRWSFFFALGGESNKGGGTVLCWKSRARRLEVMWFGTETTELGRTVKWLKLFHQLFAAIARCTSW